MMTTRRCDSLLLTTFERKLFLFFLVFLWGVPLAAETLRVCSDGCKYSSIQSAIRDAELGDTVLVEAGTYKERISFAGITVRSVAGPDPLSFFPASGYAAPTRLRCVQPADPYRANR